MLDKIQLKFVRKQNGLWDVIIRGCDEATKTIVSDITEEEARWHIEFNRRSYKDCKCIEIVVEE